MSRPEFTDQQLIEQYLKLDKTLEELNDIYKKTCEPYNRGMTAIKGMLHDRLNKRGAKHTSVNGGTAYKEETMTVKVTSKQEYLRFCFGDPDWGANLLTAHVSKDSLADFLEKHGEQPPPGVEVIYGETVRIRRT